LHRHETDDGYPLGYWVNNQRNNKDTMEPERRRRLEALAGWCWDSRSDSWEDGFSHLKQFADREGHCRVLHSHKTEDGYRLGKWVQVQRSNKDTMDPDRRQRLEGLPDWDWDPRTTQWEEGFSHLKQFSDREGHCRVAAKHKTDDGYRLGGWVSGQRMSKDQIDPGRRQRLESLPGWSWDAWSDKWEKGFAHLKEFSELKRHCRVSNKYETNGYRLGQWVAVQRGNKDSIDPDRRATPRIIAGMGVEGEKVIGAGSSFKKLSGKSFTPNAPRPGARQSRWCARDRA
jgi:Helicase associated domain